MSRFRVPRPDSPKIVQPVRVLLTEAHYKNCLAATRSLGAKGFEVVAGSSHALSQSFYSRYCHDHILYPPPERETAFVRFLRGYVKEHRIGVLLPIGYESTVTLSRHLDEFDGHTSVPIAEWRQMQIAADKRRSTEFARSLGVPVPRTYHGISEVVQYPVVAKGTLASSNVRYLNSQLELEKFEGSDVLLQEYIPGDAYGFYALFNHGEPRAFFMHRRIREFPITGGAATAAISVHDERLKELGMRLLTALKWHGVAMVEFKKDRRDGEFKLIEINPKFWGSLDLSIASGVDFPVLLVRMACEGDVLPIVEYELGVRYHWPLPDELYHLMARPSSLGPIARDSLDPRTRSNVRRDDLIANLIQGVVTVGGAMALVASKRLKYPNGRADCSHDR